MKESQIRKNFGYRLIGTNFMKRMVRSTLLLLPSEIITFVSKRCWFISSFEDGWAFVLKGKEIKKDEYVIFLSDELLREKESIIHHTIAHEIGHVILGHKNSIGRVQTKKEVERQEKEAHDFVRKYMLLSEKLFPARLLNAI